MTNSAGESAVPAPDQEHTWRTWVGVAALVYLLLVGVGVIGDGFKWISGGSEGDERIFAFASNPIVGVILGTLATALVQSSSTVFAGQWMFGEEDEQIEEIATEIDEIEEEVQEEELVIE